MHACGAPRDNISHTRTLARTHATGTCSPSPRSWATWLPRSRHMAPLGCGPASCTSCRSPSGTCQTSPAITTLASGGWRRALGRAGQCDPLILQQHVPGGARPTRVGVTAAGAWHKESARAPPSALAGRPRSSGPIMQQALPSNCLVAAWAAPGPAWALPWLGCCGGGCMPVGARRRTRRAYRAPTQSPLSLAHDPPTPHASSSRHGDHIWNADYRMMVRLHGGGGAGTACRTLSFAMPVATRSSSPPPPLSWVARLPRTLELHCTSARHYCRSPAPGDGREQSRVNLPA